MRNEDFSLTSELASRTPQVHIQYALHLYSSASSALYMKRLKIKTQHQLL